MNLDRVVIADPPQFPGRNQYDDAPEVLGDDFEITIEEKAKIHRATHPNIVMRALAGDQSRRQTLRNLGISYWRHGGRTIIPDRLPRRSLHTLGAGVGQHAH